MSPIYETDISIRSLEGVSIALDRLRGVSPGRYPTSRIQKGLILVLNGRDLSEEGVGFGVPILKSGHIEIFPGACSWRVEESGDRSKIHADYLMNLVGRLTLGGRCINMQAFYRTREWLAAVYRKHRALRKRIMWFSEESRKTASMKDAFIEVPPAGFVSAKYTIEDCVIGVEMDFREVQACEEIVVLNELGANYFDSFRDSDGLVLSEDSIGGWDEVHATEASFIDSMDGISFTLQRAERARMLRGRELYSNRLAWAGLAYILASKTDRFSYTIKLGSV